MVSVPPRGQGESGLSIEKALGERDELLKQSCMTTTLLAIEINWFAES